MIPEIGVEIEMCPSTSGFKSWRAMAFSPLTNALYIPLTLNCELAPRRTATQSELSDPTRKKLLLVVRGVRDTEKW